MLCLYSRESHHNGTLSIVKAKCTQVVYEEVYEAVNDDIAWLSRGIIQVAFYNNVFMGLNFGFATWTASWKMREESLSIFSNKSMSGDHASELSIQ